MEWGWFIGISAAVVALAFVVLVVFLCISLFSLKRTLESSGRLMEETHDVVENLQTKVHAFDSFFRAAHDVGDTVERKAHRATEELDARERVGTSLAADALEFAILGLSLWHKVKRRF